jgi:putative addiction module killer protein
VIQIEQTDIFSNWYDSLRDGRAKARIDARIYRMARGNFGDVKYFEGIGELRIDYGPGYRLYFARRGEALVLLLCGGDKGSQKRDITRARKLWQELSDDD